MQGYDVVLFLHISAVLAAFFLSGALHGADYLMKGATSMSQMRQLIRPGKLGPLFGPIVIALFGLGMALLAMSHEAGREVFHMSDPFVWTGMIVLLFLLVDGPLVLGQHGKRLEALVKGTPDGPVPDEVRTLATSTVPWAVSHANTFAALAMVLNMTAKPSAAYCVLIVVVGTAIGAALGSVLARR